MTSRDNRVTRRATRQRSIAGTADPHDLREARGMLRTLERLGYDLDGLLAAAGLQRADVENPDAYISPIACAAVFSRANQEHRIPNLALRLAHETPIGATPLLDYLIVTSDSV